MVPEKVSINSWNGEMIEQTFIVFCRLLAPDGFQPLNFIHNNRQNHLKHTNTVRNTFEFTLSLDFGFKPFITGQKTKKASFARFVKIYHGYLHM